MTAPLHSLPDVPVPEGGEATFIECNGVRIRAAKWSANDKATTKGTVVLLHGRTEFIEKYYEVIEDLRARRFAVLTFDWRGQGLSTRELKDWQRGHVRSFDHFLGDFQAVIADPFAAEMPKPWVLLSHSMGGSVALRHLQQDSETFSAAVFCAPMLGMPEVMPAPLQKALIAGAIMLGRGGKQPFASVPVDPATQPFDGNPVTTDEARFARARGFVQHEPRLGVAGISWAWVSAAAKFLSELRQPENMERVKTPCLFVTAEKELLVDRESAQRLADLSESCTARMVEGAHHEIMMERDVYRDQFFAAFDGFVAKA